MRNPRGMFWCVDCDAWRSLPDCRVCRMRDLYKRWYEINEELLALLPETIADKFSHSQTTRETYALRPKYPSMYDLDKEQQRQLLKRYQREMERYELMVYARLYDGEKHLAQRLRRFLTDEK